jgi:hypothetical protein
MVCRKGTEIKTKLPYYIAFWQTFLYSSQGVFEVASIHDQLEKVSSGNKVLIKG